MIGTALPADRVNNLELKVAGLERRASELLLADLALDSRLDAAEASLTALTAAWTAWTPDYTFGGAARTPGTPVGRYKKQGSVVNLTFSMTAQSTESGSAVRITNLPVTPLVGGVRTWGWCRTASGATGVLIMLLGTGEIEMFTNAFANPALTAGQEMAGSITYEAAP